MNSPDPFRLWIDNDACPQRIREVIYKAGKRLGIPITIVGNSYVKPPGGVDVQVICVSSAFDAADDHIADHVQKGDIVITGDVPLADRVVEKGALAISPRGKLWDKENIKEQLTLRNLRAELRSAGQITGGPTTMQGNDIHRFASALDRVLAQRSKS